MSERRALRRRGRAMRSPTGRHPPHRPRYGRRPMAATWAITLDGARDGAIVVAVAGVVAAVLAVWLLKQIVSEARHGGRGRRPRRPRVVAADVARRVRRPGRGDVDRRRHGRRLVHVLRSGRHRHPSRLTIAATTAATASAWVFGPKCFAPSTTTTSQPGHRPGEVLDPAPMVVGAQLAPHRDHRLRPGRWDRRAGRRAGPPARRPSPHPPAGGRRASPAAGAPSGGRRRGGA